MRAAVERAAEVFAEPRRRGRARRPVPGVAAADFRAIGAAPRSGRCCARCRRRRIAVMDPGLVALCRRGEAVTQEEYVEALGRRAAPRADRCGGFSTATTCCCRRRCRSRRPMPSRAPTAGRTRPTFRDWMPYTPPFNLTKNPAASIPCGFVDGLADRVAGDRAALRRSCACCRPAAPMSKPAGRSGRTLRSMPASPRSRRRAMPPSLPRSGRERTDSPLHRRTASAYSLRPTLSGGCRGEQGAEADQPGSQEAQAEKNRGQTGGRQAASRQDLNAAARTRSSPRGRT